MAKINWEDDTEDKAEPESGDNEFRLIDNGEYEVEIVTVEERFSKNPDSKAGEMIVITFKVTEGAFFKRLIWRYLCVNHEAGRTRQIAKNELKTIYNAAGVDSDADTNELVGRKLRAEITKQPATDKFGASNSISNYEKIEGIDSDVVSFEDDSIPF